MIGRFRDAVGDVEQEDAEREQDDDADLHLLRRRAEEDGQEEDGRHQARQDHVHDVERVASSHEDAERHVGEPFGGTRIEEELVPLHPRPFNAPLAVFLVAVHVDRHVRVRHVHLRDVVAPRAEHQLAALHVERVVGDVDLALRLEHAARLPVHMTAAQDDRPELAVLAVYAVCSTNTPPQCATGSFHLLLDGASSKHGYE